MNHVTQIQTKHRHEARGSVLIFVVVLLSILALLAATTLFIVHQGVKISQNAAQSVESTLAASTGLNHAKKTLRDAVTTYAIYTAEGAFYYDPINNADNPWLKKTGIPVGGPVDAVPYSSPLRLFADSSISPAEDESVALSIVDGGTTFPNTLDKFKSDYSQKYPELRFTSSPIYASDPVHPFDLALVNDVIGRTELFYKDADNFAATKFKARTLPRMSRTRGRYFVWIKDLDAKLYGKVADSPGSVLGTTNRDGWDIDVHRTLPDSVYGLANEDKWTESIEQGVLHYDDGAGTTLGDTVMLDDILKLSNTPLVGGDARYPYFYSTNELATHLASLYDQTDKQMTNKDTYALQRDDLRNYFTVYRDALDFTTTLPQKRIKDHPAAININTASEEVIAAALSRIPGENPPYAAVAHDPDIHDPMTSDRVLALAKRIISKRPFLCRMDFEDFLAAHLRGNYQQGDVVDLDYDNPNESDFNTPDETDPGFTSATTLPLVRIVYLGITRRLGPGYVAGPVSDGPVSINQANTTDQAYFSDPARTELTLEQYLEIPGVTMSNAQHLKANLLIPPLPARDYWPNEPGYQRARFAFFYNNTQGNLPIQTRKEALITPREFNNIVNSFFSGGDDIQNIPIGTTTTQPVVLAGPDGVLQTIPAGDDRFQQRITAGPNTVLDSPVLGDDVLVAGAITPGPDGVLQSVRKGDDIQETDMTAIWPGPNGIAETIAASSRPSYYSYIDDSKFAEKFWDAVDSILPAPPNLAAAAIHLLDPNLAALSVNVPGYGAMTVADADKRASQVMRFYYRLPIVPGTGMTAASVANDYSTPPPSQLVPSHLVSWRCLPQGLPATTPFDPTMESDRRPSFFQMCFDDWTTYTPTLNVNRCYGPMQCMGDPDIYSFGIDDSDVYECTYSSAKPWSGNTPGTPFDADRFGIIDPGEDTVGNGDVSWSPKITFRSRFFNVFVLGQGLAGPESATTVPTPDQLQLQGEKRIEAVYDALLDQIIWQRSPVTDKRSMGDPVAP